MENPLKKLKELLKNKELANDGSIELAKEWEHLLEHQEDLNALLNNEAFKTIIASLEADFKARMATLVNSDPHLSEIKKMMIRTVGLKDAESRIEKQMVEYLREN